MTQKNSNMEPKTPRINREAFNRFTQFIREREAIRMRREQKFKAPWTGDTILRAYHFTNIKREDDRVSRFLFEDWYPTTIREDSPRDSWAAIMIARFVNNPAALAEIAGFIFEREYHDAWMQLEERAESKKKVFRAAYLQPEIKGVTRLEKIFGIFVPQILAQDISTASLEEAVADLCKVKYFGEFIAGQIALDALNVIPGKWSDSFTYAPIGPGSTRGLNRLRDLPLTRKLKRDRYEHEISELHTCPEMNRWRALDLEHALCEWDKYERIRLGEGSYNRKR
jgi:hypothetical protein